MDYQDFVENHPIPSLKQPPGMLASAQNAGRSKTSEINHRANRKKHITVMVN